MTATEPGNAGSLPIEAGFEFALLKLDGDGRGIDRSGGVYEVAEDAPRSPKEPVEATRHERELEVTVNFHRDR